MKFNLTKLATVLALSVLASTSANAAVSSAANGANGNSTLIFSVWDDAANSGAGAGYSLDLGTLFQTVVGADTGDASTPTVASGSTWTGFTTQHIALTGLNVSAGLWNLAAADSFGRSRVLTTNIDTDYVTNFTGKSGAVNTAALSFNNYIGLGAAAAVGVGTTSTSVDDWYAGSSSWGDGFGGVNRLDGTSSDFNSASNLYVLWQKDVGVASTPAGIAALHDAYGHSLSAFLTVEGGTTYLNIAAVPEADTSGMMIAGLGLMGFIARRRNTKKA